MMGGVEWFVGHHQVADSAVKARRRTARSSIQNPALVHIGYQFGMNFKPRFGGCVAMGHFSATIGTHSKANSRQKV
jgi:hypothetical protein